MRISQLALYAALLLSIACTFSPTQSPIEAQTQPITVTPGAVIVPNGDVTIPQSPPPTQEPPAPQPSAANTTRIGPQTYPDNINPLTGQVMEDPSRLALRPVVSKISNAPPLVRPQAGIGQADLVFEHYAEGGLTRFSAVFHSVVPSRVGSVRSARLIDHELAAMYQALLVFSGGSTGVEEIIFGTEATGIVEARQAEGKPILPPSDYAARAFKGVLFGPPYYFRDESIPVPHNLFANAQAISDLATNQGVNGAVDLRGMTFDPVAPAGASGTADRLDVRYRGTRVQWAYDAERGQYLRTADGQIHADITTGQQIAAENVVVIYADHSFSDIVESEWQGSRSYSILIRVWFEGEALIARDGQWYAARWQRPTRESLIWLTTPEGDPLPFKPGRTFFQLMPLPDQLQPESEWVRVETNEAP